MGGCITILWCFDCGVESRCEKAGNDLCSAAIGGVWLLCFMHGAQVFFFHDEGYYGMARFLILLGLACIIVCMGVCFSGGPQQESGVGGEESGAEVERKVRRLLDDIGGRK